MATIERSSFSTPSRVAVVGVGNVGATFAYALLLSGLAAEIALIDVNRAKAEGEAMDLNHAVPFSHPTKIWAGDFPDCAQAAVVVMAAGANQKPGETRLDLIYKNATIWRQVIPEIVKHNRSTILLIATNPVDALTYAAWKLSGLPSHQVIGSGTTLDTARFRYLLSQQFGVDARSVHAYIIGEHGDSEVPVWSLANIAGMHLKEFAAAQGQAYDPRIMDEIFRQTRDAAYLIIERKGATYYAVAAGLMRITQAILRNQNTVLSVSSLIEDYYGISNVCLSLPTVVNRNGVEKVLRIELDHEEVERLRRSADVLKETISKLGM
ncbi:MAG TPA: L-lactate dehydrogenase [Terriglobales bacterium]|nr:L-lactate dehydrogenase [Terriglobales bacterium]